MSPTCQLQSLSGAGAFFKFSSWHNTHPSAGRVLIVMFIYRFGPISCIALALWRIGQRDYGSTDGDVNSNKNLMPALDVFYSLVVCQGVFYLLWFIADYELVRLLNSAREECELPQASWSRASLVDYLFDFQERCRRDPTSTHRRTLRHYAVDLLDSGSWEDNVSGARMLGFFIQQGQDVRSLLLPSRPKIQKLIDALGWRNGLLQAGASSSREMRVHAAYIVAHLASDIHLAQFPGAIRCISSLFQDEETTCRMYSLSSNAHPHSETPPKKRDMIRRLRKVEYKHGAGDQQEEVGDGAGGCNELILQGLKILKNLASDQHNCRDICSTPGFVRKIMEPIIYSATLIQDIKIIDWAQVVIASFSVLNQLLVSATGKTGRRLRREISTNKQAMANLDYIIDQRNGANQVLQMQALEILTHLASDLSINLSTETKENLIKKQLQIFLLADEDRQVPISVADYYDYDPLKATAAQALALLSTSSENCAFIMRGCDDIILCYLAEKLSASNNVVYRRNAADILGKLCTHCSLDKEYVKEILLPKVLTEILSTTRESAQSEISTPENYKENQKNYASEQDEENPRSISTQAVNTEIREISSSVDQYKSFDVGNEEETATKELQEAFLSLTLVIYDKIISADDFDDVLQKKAQQGAFVGKLKSIVKENCQATPESLRTVKLCGQIAVSMMRRNQYTAQFKDQKFVKSLSKCSGIMSNLESSMLFSGTDFGHNNTVRPLLYDIKNEALGLVNC